MKKKAANTEKNALMRAINRNRFCIYAFFISAAIMLFVYIVYKFIPFGKMSILRMDLYHQYGPLFAELYERLVNLDSLLYSWTSGLGGSFTGNYLNYLSSPLGNLIMLLAGHDNMPEAIAVMVLLKAALTSATFTYFINNHFDRRDASSAAFGVLYAFCGFFVAYYWNIMWLDGMLFFPLVVLGITKIIDGKSPWLYMGALACTMLTSYYMAYMICILSVVWFVYYFFSYYDFSSSIRPYDLKMTKREYNSLSSSDKFKLTRRSFINNRFICTGLKFAGSSFLAFGVAAVALVPLYFILKACSATGNSFPTSYKSYFTVFDFLANHLAGATPTIRSSGTDVLPNIYSGVLPLLLVPIYLFSKKISFREKVASTCVLALFYFSFNVNYLNFIWHGFHFPNDLPYRFSFAYSFFLLYLSYKAFQILDSISSKALIGSGIGVIAFTVLVQKIGSKNIMVSGTDGTETANETIVWATIIFAVIYCVVLGLMKNPKYLRSAMCALLLCCTVTEIIVVDTGNYEFQQEKAWFTNDYANFVPLKEEIDAKETAENPNGFYRMELSNLRARMDPCWYYYNGVSIFSSMAYESVSKMMKDIGMYGNDVNSYTYYPQTPVFNTMFAMKYVFDNDNRLSEDGFYTLISSNDTYKVYEYQKDMPLVFCVEPALAEWKTNGENPFDDQAAMWSLATGASGVFKDLDVKVDKLDNLGNITDDAVNTGKFTCTKVSNGVFAALHLKITPEESGYVYIYAHSADSDTCFISAPQRSPDIELDSPYIADCGYVEAGEEVTAELQLPNDKDTADVKFYAVMLNEDVFDQGFAELTKGGTLNFTSFDEDTFSGTIHAEKDKLLYTSIPYDEGWTVLIDGMKVNVSDYEKIDDSLLALPIPAGDHTVEFRYLPKGMEVGAIMTAVSVLLLILIAICKKKKLLFFSEKVLKAVTLCDFEPTIRLPLDDAAEDFEPFPLTEPDDTIDAAETDAPDADETLLTDLPADGGSSGDSVDDGEDAPDGEDEPADGEQPEPPVSDE